MSQPGASVAVCVGGLGPRPVDGAVLYLRSKYDLFFKDWAECIIEMRMIHIKIITSRTAGIL